MKTQRKIIQIDESLCNGCEQCIPACPEQAIQMVDTPDGKKARLVKEIYCDGLGACLGNCPTGALTIREREAEAYDDEATLTRLKQIAPELVAIHKQHLREHAPEMASQSPMPPGCCPSARMLHWAEEDTQQQADPVANQSAVVPQSALQQWPVQLHLVPPHAPYFKNADLHVVADCVPCAFANFHQEFLKGPGKAIAIGCPKLDDAGAYVEKLAQIIAVGQPRRITVVNMEVPCCFGLVRVVERALEQAGKDVPVKTVTISIKGDKLT
jgi:Fe-S-cluster-containing hydrogenase component 2